MKKHGKTTFFWEKDLFIVELQGPFNEEGQEYSTTHLKHSVLNQKLKHWRRLEVLCDETMGSPAVLSMVKELYSWYEENGCYVLAVVIKNSLQKDVLERVFKSNIVKIFLDRPQAIEWLEAQKTDT